MTEKRVRGLNEQSEGVSEGPQCKGKTAKSAMLLLNVDSVGKEWGILGTERRTGTEDFEERKAAQGC